MGSLIIKGPESELNSAPVKAACTLHDTTEIVVVQPPTSDDVCRGDGITRCDDGRSAVKRNVVVRSVLLVVTSACRVVQCCPEVPCSGLLTHMHLVVILAVVIHLVFVVVVVVLAATCDQVFDAR